MLHLPFYRAAVRTPRSLFALAPPGGRLFGLVLVGAGMVLLGLASAPMLAGADTPPPCDPPPANNVQCFFTPAPEEGVPIRSLRDVKKPTDPLLAPGGPYIRSQWALVALGKALFWDQQVGSDGQACGSCHFSAGADARTRNQVSPGLKANDTTFQIGSGPNHELQKDEFPIHALVNPDIKSPDGVNVKRDANDVISSAGVFARDFSSIQANDKGSLRAPRPAFDTRAMDNCTSATLDTSNFHVGDVNVRRVEPRNTPTMINAMFNNRNFWDSRAQDVFNGVNPFGARDTSAVVYENKGGIFSQASPVSLRLAFSSLASQAVGPPLSDFEMSCAHRTFPDVGHKLLRSTTTPLAQQEVSRDDSVLGPISNARYGLADKKGLYLNYPTLVLLAFQPRWWSSLVPVDTNSAAGKRPQIEANFSMFWGLAVGAYMETLKADQSKIDLFFDGTVTLTDSELRGLKLFESAGGERPDPVRKPTTRVPAMLFDGKTPADLRCTTCHGGPETTAARIDAVRNDARLERMAMPIGANGKAGCAIYDAGHFNTGVRRTTDDVALGGLDNSNHPLGETQIAIDALTAGNPSLISLVPTAAVGQPTPPNFGLVPALGGTTNCDFANVMGTFKAPQLRNVELTGPYFHNGGQVTLRQVIDFYNRGGDFVNTGEFDPNVHPLGLGEQDKIDLVNFLKALTDERVAYERAPFDHPAICVAAGEEFGASNSESTIMVGSPLPGGGTVKRAEDHVTCFPASGAAGLTTRIKPFLSVDQQSP